MQIQWAGAMLALVAELHMSPALAQTPAAGLAAQGRTACEAVMSARHMGEPEGSLQRHHAQATGVKTEALCECTAGLYARGMAARPTSDEGQMLERSLKSCLPPAGTLPASVQRTVRAGPQAAQALSPAQQQAETRLCRDMAQGRLKPPGLDMPYIRDWEQASGLQAADLCGACVIADMEDESAAARGQGEVWDALKREQMLVRALHNCQHWTYRMQARP